MDIEQLRILCLSLPNATEDVKWGKDLCFCIGEKMFCVTELESPQFKASFKVKPEEFEELVESDGIIPAPYVARYKWILVIEPGRFTKQEWEHYIAQSYKLVKSRLPKKVLEKLVE